MSERRGTQSGAAWGPGTLLLALFCTVVAVPCLALLIPELTSEAVVGIDLGTTFSVVALCQAGRVSVVQIDGAPTMPSVVSYNAPPHGRTVVGAAAAALRSERPVWTVHDSKRLIGRAFADPLVQQEAAHLPYGVVAGGADGQTAALEVGGPAFGGGPAVTPEAVAATLLRQLKRAAERARPVASLLGFSFGSATVSVPVAFDRRQRAATLAAGRAAGFRLVRLLEEPVAAAVAYGLHDSGGERTVVVYDMGGGTLDVAVLRLERASRTFLVMATAGDPHLGGEDFDRALAAWVRARTQMAHMSDEGTSAALLVAVEAAKRRLSQLDSTTVAMPAGLPPFALTVADAELAVTPLLDRAVAPIDTALRLAGLAAEDIDDVVLVGGASQLHAVRARVAQAFDGRTLHLGLDPDTAIAIGAARAYNC